MSETVKSARVSSAADAGKSDRLLLFGQLALRNDVEQPARGIPLVGRRLCFRMPCEDVDVGVTARNVMPFGSVPVAGARCDVESGWAAAPPRCLPCGGLLELHPEAGVVVLEVPRVP